MRLKFSTKKEQKDALKALSESGLVKLVPDSRDHFRIYQAGRYDPAKPSQGFLGYARATNILISREFGFDGERTYLDSIKRATSSLNWEIE